MNGLSELPQDADRRHQRQPRVLAILKVQAPIVLFVNIVVRTTNVAPVGRIGYLEERSKVAASDIEFSADSQVYARES